MDAIPMLLGAIETVAQMRQDRSLHSENMIFNRESYQAAIRLSHKNYELDKTALSVSKVNCEREDIRDLSSQQNRRIENLMLVNTLLFSFSFGFVCEGTFPYREYRGDMLYVYVVLMAMTLILPFWSIFLLLECQRSLDKCFKRILKEGRDMRFDMQFWLKNNNDFWEHWDEDCKMYYRCAITLFWLGMLCCLTLAACLTGINFLEWYPDEVAWTFVLIVMVNVGVSLLIFIVKICRFASNKRATNRTTSTTSGSRRPSVNNNEATGDADELIDISFRGGSCDRKSDDNNDTDDMDNDDSDSNNNDRLWQ